MQSEGLQVRTAKLASPEFVKGCLCRVSLREFTTMSTFGRLPKGRLDPGENPYYDALQEHQEHAPPSGGAGEMGVRVNLVSPRPTRRAGAGFSLSGH